MTLADLISRAEALVPRLRERASHAEALRHLPDETVQDFLDAGLFRVLQPRRWGGLELDYGRTQTELCNVLGRGCGSSAWVQCVIACHAWCLAMFPPEAQDAVWGRERDTLIASAFAFTTGRGRPVDGGYAIEGNWQFSSGSNACQWIILGTPIFDGDGPPVKNLWCLVERPNWEVVDTWYAAGLKGSASNDIHVSGAFVPEAFTLNTIECDGRPTPGSALNPSYNYRLPLWSVFPYNVSTPALGIARGAIEAYVAYMAARPERANMAQRHLRISESAAEVDAAQALWLSNASALERLGPTGGPWSPAFQAKLRRDLAYSTMLCTRAVDRLATALGAHGMLEDTPVQRAFRDVHAVANHGANNWDLQAVPYAREVLRLPPLQGR
ncbi:MAG: acyl-CoA dehydrogenase [Chloroflexi bacterium]|nr:acyl-CoA dehydrogenase [Chloroflexota bacterium]